jgi:NAD(P)-dependent dehydrogenase (short-subunit alcohol dehydrogenase family)
MSNNPFDLTGRTAIVTGGNQGLGRAFAFGIAAAGAHVAIAGRSAERNEKVVAEAAAEGFTFEAITADITEHADIERMTVEAIEKLGKIDILVNNAGAHMRERGTGSIVNIGSMSGIIVNRPQMQPAYNASKAAVHHLTKSLAAEWGPLGIRVNAVAPGYCKTEMAPVDRPDLKRYWIDDAPMQRYAMPEEIAPSVVFLASDAASFITGSVLVADGGYTAW